MFLGMYKTTNTKKGFTLIETMVAVFMLLMVIAVSGNLFFSGFRLSTSASTRLEAQYLAEEAIEYIRNLRDSSILDGNAFLSDIHVDCVGGGRWCRVDVYTGVFRSCTGNVCYIRYNESDECGNPDLVGCERTYGHGSAYNNPTIFKREVNIEPQTLNPPFTVQNEALVRVRVLWNERGEMKNIEINEYIRSFGLDG
jgi:prepilin-type N-terminal cleavage/methylation domain-containing protein